MSEHDSSSLYSEPNPGEFKRVLAATAVIGALFLALVALAPLRDPSRVVAGLPCSVISEEAIGTVLGTPVRLTPTSGTVCQYVSTGPMSRTLFVVARHDALLPTAMADGVHVAGLGDDAVRAQNALYVRYGKRSYTFDIVPHAGDDAPLYEQELRLAKLMHEQMVANR